MARPALAINNLPTPKDEAWKYTNLPRAVPAGLRAQAPEERTVHIKRGQAEAQPVEIIWSGTEGALHYPVLNIVVEDGAQATVIEKHEGQGAYWKNMTAAITLGAGARLNHVRLQNDDARAVHTTMTTVTLARDAVYDGFALNVGAKMMRHDIAAAIEGAGAECSFNGINLLDGERHADTTILMEHKAPHSRSNQFYRSLLNGTSRGVFQGKVHVHKPAQKTDAYQLSNAILLSPRAEMDTKPELEIYADDVKCSHGATTGALDEAPLFYLRSRGLSAGAARCLLVQAFVDEVVDKIADEARRGEVAERVEQWLRQNL